MRTIDPQPEPREVTHWRAGAQGDVNFGYALMPADVRLALKTSLVAEQRGLCAYTGIGIDPNNSHIEHLIPQAHCQAGEDVAQSNMVACYPAPGAPYFPFGALRKGNWPAPAERHLFVSPRSPGCEQRFAFNLRGEIASTSPADHAAKETIRRLGLDHARLTAIRRDAIGATLQVRGSGPASLDLRSSRRRLAGLEHMEAGAGRLEPFSFALKQALTKHIRRLEAIRQSKRRGI